MRKYCLKCLGRYRIEAMVDIHGEALKVKVMYFKVGEKGSKVYLEGVKVKLVAHLKTVGKQVLC